ncbi:hypothetical protein LUZ61_019858 [Rhynchospora tenuis]|uniref:Heat shock protein 70 n=1 Tax=Rhynchospora tenuis TaxID=198213 RepID=A0AAD6EN87_9POAL|nr:hypothetical protein LUZ61_019858 [Rhynchospora tenuis]
MDMEWSRRKGPAIGIDLGTAYTCAALFDGRCCRMIPDNQSLTAMPSYVAFTNLGVLVGEAAKRQAMQNPTNTIFDIIRLIGRCYFDPSLKNDLRRWPFKVTPCQNDRLLVQVHWKGKLWQFSPVEICSMILMQIKENAEKNLRATITDAVITVPVRFNYEQRQAIKEAGMIAGLNFMQIISAPGASALFYSTVWLSKNSTMPSNIPRSTFTSEPEEYNMIIFDLGAGTLDVALITTKDDVCKVRATAGDDHLGGSDFDKNMVCHFVNSLERHTDISDIFRAISEHRTAIEMAKVALKFNELNKELFIKCVNTIITCLRDANMAAGMVHEVILVGGSTRIPWLQFHINQHFKGKLKVTDHLETAVAYGAALQASFLNVNGTLKVTAEEIFTGTRNSITLTTNNIEDSQKRLWEALLYKEGNTTGQSSKQNVEPEEYAIGIDFGTTYSCVAVWRHNGVKIIENEYGNHATFSCVAFTGTGRLIGDTANKDTINPANTIARWRQALCSRGDCRYDLSKMKEIAETHLSSKVTKAVISVPACFSDSQRKAIKDAGVIAGLNVMQLLNEPTAAAIAYYLQKMVGAESPDARTLLNFDLGGGNLDVSIVTINEGNIQVQAVVGDTNLGGEDFDNNLVFYFVEKFRKEKNRDISNKPRSLRRLRAACEKAKRVISTRSQTVVQQLLQDFFNGKELCKSINTDEAVAYGAAVRAAILNANKDSEKFNILNLQDITSLSFGLKYMDGSIMNVLIPKHTPVLTKKELLIMTCSDQQSSFSIEVQECELASMTVFNLSGMTTKGRRNLKINLCFEVDDSGILNLTAKDMSTSEKNETVISQKNGSLTPEEIEKLVEAEARYKEEDAKHKVRVAALNSLEYFAYRMKAIARDPKVSASDKILMEEAAYQAIAWLNTNHSTEIEEIDNWKRHLEAIKSLEEAADKAIAWLDTNYQAETEQIIAWKRYLETIESQSHLTSERRREGYSRISADDKRSSNRDRSWHHFLLCSRVAEQPR